jgi:putative flippase GtrA
VDVRRRHLALAVGLAIVLVPGLALLMEEAGHGVAVSVAVAAIATLVGSYVLNARVRVRSLEDEDTKARLQHRVRTHVLIMFGAPLLVLAAHPWGKATFAVAGGMLVLQAVFTHAMIAVGLAKSSGGP